MSNFRIGIMGAGNIGTKFCDAVKVLDNAEVVAISSKSLDRAKSFAEKNDIVSYYDSYEEMLKRDDIDGIYIATTHNFHYENAKLCLDYNKPFICEKAFMLSYAESKEIFEIAEKKGIFTMEAMWSRFLPAIKNVKSWIDNGAIGQIDLASFIIGFKADDCAGSRMYEPSLAGGAMFDIGVYAIEITTHLIDEKLIDVKSVISKAHTGVDKVDSIVLQFENCIANLNCIITSNVPNELNIYGTKGRIHIKDPHFASSAELYDTDNKLIDSFKLLLDNGFEHEIREFIDCVKSNKLESLIIPHKDTLQCAEIFDKCLK